jgi:hypothetical protein
VIYETSHLELLSSTPAYRLLRAWLD